MFVLDFNRFEKCLRFFEKEQTAPQKNSRVNHGLHTNIIPYSALLPKNKKNNTNIKRNRKIPTIKYIKPKQPLIIVEHLIKETI